MPKVRASSGTIGTIRSPISLSRSSFDRMRTNTIVVEALRAFGALAELLEHARRAPTLSGSTRTVRAAPGRRAPCGARGCTAARGCLRPDGRTASSAICSSEIGNAEARAERAQVRLVHLLLLVRDVLALTRLAHAVALDGAREDDGRLPLRFVGALVGVVDLRRIVAAEAQALQLVVGQVLDHVEQPRIGAEEVLAEVGTRLDGVFLVLAVDDLAHPLREQAVVILGEQRIPVAAPQHLDDVPAGAAEDRFELLDDLAVAAHRPVEPLQVAVDDPDQVVELLARGEADRAERLGLVGFAVAEERPHLAGGRLLQVAIFEVAIEARLVDRHDRAEAHRHRRELPEVGHQPRDADTTTARRRDAVSWRKFSSCSCDSRPSRNARA